MYASIADLRSEGVSVAQASNARLRRLSREASAEIDRVTGCFFEPREMRYCLNGRGVATLWLPAHPIALSEVLVEGKPLSLDLSELVVVGAPVVPGEDGPRLDEAKRSLSQRPRQCRAQRALWFHRVRRLA